MEDISTTGLAAKGDYVDGLRHGTWEIFRDDDTRFATINYRHGMVEGTSILYDNDGKTVIRSADIKNGLCHGVVFSKTADGYTSYKCVNGVKHGNAEVIKNGKVTTAFNFCNGALDGKNMIRRDDGEITVMFKNGIRCKIGP
jgi:antitoxin component YwqK of YwqJK toxin-antitoxin module